jgi:hypothetical protein
MVVLFSSLQVDQSGFSPRKRFIQRRQRPAQLPMQRLILPVWGSWGTDLFSVSELASQQFLLQLKLAIDG